MTDRPSDSAPLEPPGRDRRRDRRSAFLGLLAVGLVALVLLGPRRGGARRGRRRRPSDAASFAYADGPARAGPRADGPGRAPVRARLAARPAGARVLRLHALPRRLPGDRRRGQRGPGARPGTGPRAVFASIDPERDDAAAMKSYLRYLPKAYIGLSGTPQEVRAQRGPVGREVREDRPGLGGRLRDGPHGRHLPRRRAGHAPGALPVRDAGRSRSIDALGRSSPRRPRRRPADDRRRLGLRVGRARRRRRPGDARAGGARARRARPRPRRRAACSSRRSLSTSIWAGSGDPVILRVVDDAGTQARRLGAR